MVIRADLPGLTKDDVDIEVTDEAITLKGEAHQGARRGEGGLYRVERAYGGFCRAIPLPDGIKPEEVKATFKNGVLEVTAPLPAATKKPKARRVEIQETAGEKKAQSAA